MEQASLRQMYKSKMEELRAESQQSSESIGLSKGASISSSQQQISVTVVTNLDAGTKKLFLEVLCFRHSLLHLLLMYGRAVFTCLLDQVSLYITEGLERARHSLTEAAALRDQ